ncbi:Fic family protein [Algoriphagus halophytocola]|uniref:Fic family protein n=1 Tax=Algoriphagus halophytocola TaxID=2991499 RepID=A0ABY6MFD2_9BACT|nr:MULTISPECIES: Fic family protein [unclassified Algoriphagus]UZD21346.1 Fic family protein [Algoriphagus sp. TR-M5]WBL42558.1 Fic family protein [Algoriphagus sp. TR-M9]
MSYNWEQSDWPKFTYKEGKSGKLLPDFLMKSGQLSGVLIGLSEGNQTELLLEMMVVEAIKTSEIEGEFLSRPDVMSSIKKNLGIHEEQPLLVKDQRAKGIAKLMIKVRSEFAQDLTQEMLFDWHELLMEGNRYVRAGQWRADSAPMQVVSGAIGKEIVHFEAPPSTQVPSEMAAFISWFNETAPGNTKEINNPLIRSAITHLYFESIHPFEDGNGRIGRALAEKAIHQGLGHATLISLSSTIEAKKNEYYSALKNGQSANEISDWLDYFADTVFDAQLSAEQLINFTLQKVKFFDRFKDMLNDRHSKAINRMLAEGPAGFEVGMTAKKYMAITKASKATATRDLQALVELGVFLPQGGGRSVSYELVISS